MIRQRNLENTGALTGALTGVLAGISTLAAGFFFWGKDKPSLFDTPKSFLETPVKEATMPFGLFKTVGAAVGVVGVAAAAVTYHNFQAQQEAAQKARELSDLCGRTVNHLFFAATCPYELTTESIHQLRADAEKRAAQLKVADFAKPLFAELFSITSLCQLLVQEKFFLKVETSNGSKLISLVEVWSEVDSPVFWLTFKRGVNLQEGGGFLESDEKELKHLCKGGLSYVWRWLHDEVRRTIFAANGEKYTPDAWARIALKNISLFESVQKVVTSGDKGGLVDGYQNSAGIDSVNQAAAYKHIIKMSAVAISEHCSDPVQKNRMAAEIIQTVYEAVHQVNPTRYSLGDVCSAIMAEIANKPRR
ncbi:MAG: hypothetical protein EOM62_18295 [Bacteroidia bacterium]|nr:hypothetical protein [Bacteroidia bacterium]